VFAVCFNFVCVCVCGTSWVLGHNQPRNVPLVRRASRMLTCCPLLIAVPISHLGSCFITSKYAVGSIWLRDWGSWYLAAWSCSLANRKLP
jgi:hypothetical protein